MTTELTKGIEVKVISKFEPDVSKPLVPAFIFSYEVTITNKTKYPVKLISRAWHIVDSIGEHTDVKGEGVIGLQPVILPDSNFTYESNCILKSGLGYMQGFYKMKDTATNKYLTIKIPKFELLAPFVLN